MIRLFIVLLLSYSFLSGAYDSRIEIYNQMPKEHRSSQKIYGMFAEFILDWVNGPDGIWAQEFMHRGFDQQSGEFNGTANYWDKFGENTLIELVRGGYNQNGVYYQKIVTENDAGGISQNIQIDGEVENDFYIYARAEEVTDLIIEIFNLNGKEVVYQDTIQVSGNEWNKYEKKIPVIGKHFQVSFRIYIPENSAIHLDESSLVPTDNYMGLRREFKEILDYWKPGIIRYPGGTFADQPTNKLSHQIGHLDQRESPNIVYGKDYERMDWGLDEFLQMCEQEGIEAHICVNYESGTPEEAANMVEYCNGSIDTEYGSLRAANGRAEPYNVKYWEIGNEQWTDPKGYGIRFLDFEKTMKQVDPDILLICDGNNWGEFDFFNLMVSELGEVCDYYGYHPAIWQQLDHPGTAEQKYLIDVGAPNWYFERQLIDIESWIEDFGLKGKMFQASTEWWSTYGTLQDWLIDTNEMNNSIQSALANAANTMMYQRYPEEMKFAERTLALGMVNRTRDSNGKRVYYPKTNLHAMHLLGEYSGNEVYDLSIDSPSFIFTSDSLWTGQDVNYVDASFTADEDFYYLAVLNRHPHEDTELTIDFAVDNTYPPLIIHSMEANHFLDRNRSDNPNRIRPIKTKSDNTNKVLIKKHSMKLIQIPRRDGLNVNLPIEDLIFTHNGNTLNIQLENESGNYMNSELIDLSGRILFQKNEALKSGYNVFQYYVDLNPGPYFLRITIDGKQVVKKIISY